MQIDGDGKLLFGAGEYMPPPHRLKALRQHMVDDAAGFRKVLKNKSWWPLWRHPERRQAAASAERLRPGARAHRVHQAQELLRVDRDRPAAEQAGTAGADAGGRPERRLPAGAWMRAKRADEE
jgi:hypothetical protein